MKDILIVILGFWVFTLWKKTKDLHNSQPIPAGSVGNTAGSSVVARPENQTVRTSDLPTPALSVYGSTKDPAGSQRLTIDISSADASIFRVGQGVQVLNSKMYPLYYRVSEINQKEAGIVSVVVSTLYIGSEAEVFLSPQGVVTAFTPTTTKKGSFL